MEHPTKEIKEIEVIEKDGVFVVPAELQHLKERWTLFFGMKAV
jgi:hypothetical protein